MKLSLIINIKQKILLKKNSSLTSSKSVSNLHLYNKDGTITKYDDIYKIQDEHYYVRLGLYQERKDYQLDNLENQIKFLEALRKVYRICY